MKCSACAKTGLRRTQRALIVPAGRFGRVCGQCARLGILLVIGDDRPAPNRKAARKPKSRLAPLLAPTGFELAASVPRAAERCTAHTDRTKRRCMLPAGHEGTHRSMLGGAWEAES